MELRPYQREAHSAIFREWDGGRKRTLLVMPTGSGKTRVFCSISEEVVRRGGRVLILAHRGELLDQAADKMHKATGLACALEKAESTCLGEWERITVGSVQTLMRPQRLRRFPADYYRTVIVDEAHHCHPAGTLVDGRPIESLRVGDEITSFNHTIQRLERKPITAVMSKQADAVIRIILSDNSSMACTADHPVWNGNSYVNAAALRIGDLVYKRSSRNGDQAENMLGVRHCLSTQIVEQHNDSVLFSSVQDKSKGSSSQDSRCDMFAVRKGIHDIGTPTLPGHERENLLLQRVQFHGTIGVQFTEDGGNKQEVRIGTHEAKKPDEIKSQPRQDEGEIEGASICESHGEWILHKTSANTVRRALPTRRWICTGTGSLHSGSQIESNETAKQLQGRHRPRSITGSHRGGREVTQTTSEKGGRQKEDGHLEGVRVVRVEVHKRGSGRGFDEVCPGGMVYNIEVTDNHNFFADGILVHNCLSSTYQRVLGHFTEADVLGVTATPDRGDKQNLGQFFESLAYEYTLPAAVRDGYLCPIVAKTVPLQIDLAGVKQQNGDYQVAGLATALDPYLEQIADEMLQHKDRKIVVFLPLIATAKKFTHLLKCRGLNATEVNGESMDRAEILQRFDRQTGGILCNALLLTEGWDCPSVDCICVLRPTRIRSLYCLDSSTEILTEDGWKRDVQVGEMVAAFNPKTEEISFVRATGKIRRQLAGDEYFVSFSGQSVDIRVTNNHRMIYDHKRLTGWKIKTAESLARLRDTSYIPVSGTRKSPGVPLSDAEIRFIGLVMTDGSINKANGAITITQGEHQPWVRYIEQCIVDCGFKFNRFTRSRSGTVFNQTSKSVVWTISKGKPRGRDKHLRGWGSLAKWMSKDFSPALLGEISPRQFGVLIEAIHVGDGAKQDNQKWTRRSYHIGTGNLLFAERLQTCAVLCGYRANVAVDHSSARKSPFYFVHLKRQRWSRVGGHQQDRPQWTEESHSPEECWCVENEIGTLVTRRNGKVAIVGNCQMVGRGTRIHPGKDNLLILDFLWHTSSHELCRPAHLICETVETASAMTEILSESAGTEMDLLELEAQAESNVVAEREEALAKKLSEMRTKKAKLVDPLQYEMSIGAEDLVDYQPAFGWEMAPASDSQLEALEKNGIFAAEIANAGKASLLLDRLQKRRQAGLASPKQIRLLERMGFQHVGQWPFDGASRMISRISACGWRVPAGVVPASYQPSAFTEELV